MYTLSLIGIGCGDPDHLTLAAMRAIKNADLILIPRKGADKSDLAELRLTICSQALDGKQVPIVEFELPRRDETDRDYERGVVSWHDAVAEAWSREISAHLGTTGRVVFLIWGDPSLYDSSLRIARRLNPQPAVDVVPGITSIQALCAAHKLPINDIGEAFLVTTGRRLRERGWPAGVDTVMVMLDAGEAFLSLDPHGLTIWWGAYVGMPDEIIMSGALSAVGQQIADARRAARERHGWIMDVYMLKRSTDRHSQHGDRTSA